jgi:hypothetical protein
MGLGFAAIAGAASCGGVQGTYGDAGAIQIVLKSGGAATMSMMGEKKDCTYTVDKKNVTLDCKMPDGPMNLTLSDDGTTLQGPGGVPLKKQ